MVLAIDEMGGRLGTHHVLEILFAEIHRDRAIATPPDDFDVMDGGVSRAGSPQVLETPAARALNR